AEAVGDRPEFVPDKIVQASLVGEDRLELADLRPQLVALGLELDTGELGEAAQPQLKDVLRLHLREVEDGHEAPACFFRVVRTADDLDDLVDVEDRDEESVDEVEAPLSLLEAVLAAPTD